MSHCTVRETTVGARCKQTAIRAGERDFQDRAFLVIRFIYLNYSDDRMDEKGMIDPLNVIMGLVALVGGILIIFNKGDYGLILLIIATLIEALSRMVK